MFIDSTGVSTLMPPNKSLQYFFVLSNSLIALFTFSYLYAVSSNLSKFSLLYALFCVFMILSSTIFNMFASSDSSALTISSCIVFSSAPKVSTTSLFSKASKLIFISIATISSFPSVFSLSSSSFRIPSGFFIVPFPIKLSLLPV